MNPAADAPAELSSTVKTHPAALVSWLFTAPEGQGSRSDPQESGFHNRQDGGIDVDRCR